MRCKWLLTDLKWWTYGQTKGHTLLKGYRNASKNGKYSKILLYKINNCVESNELERGRIWRQSNNSNSCMPRAAIMYKTKCMAGTNFWFKNRYLKAQKQLPNQIFFSYPVWLLDHMLSSVLHGYNRFYTRSCLDLRGHSFLT